MNKQQMEYLMPTVAKSQITPDAIEARYARLSYEGDGLWDVWIRHKDCDEGVMLSSRKLSAILFAIDLPADRLSDEAVLEMTTAQVEQYAKVLGIRARRNDAKIH